MQRYGSGGNTVLFWLTLIFIFLAPPLGTMFFIMFLSE